jgi:DNA-binding response OmpR family regulator
MPGRDRTSPIAERAHLLVVDDDPQLLMLLADKLRRDGYDVAAAHSGPEALAALDERWPQLVILDLMMPEMSGEEVAERIKARVDIPIIILSAVTAAESKVGAIQRYAEDYVTKPFNYLELSARVERVLRRLNEKIPSQELVLGPDLTLMLARRRARVGDAAVGLSRIETRVLGTLAAARGEPVTTETLLARVWSHSDGADPSYVWVTMRRLRQKIERDPDNPRYLISERGGGYRLQTAESASG